MMGLDERKKKVLAAIVNDYVSTAEPVGSRTIARKYNLGVSPATIRNEMADLEELGYIEQPHTSSGRIPSDRGYRYYVDCLMERYCLTSQEQEYIQERFAKKMHEIEDLIQRSTNLLSIMSRHAAVILAPSMGRSTFQRVQLMLLEPTKALLVVITSTMVVQHQVLDIRPGITEQDLERVSKVLNSRLKGVALEQLKQETFDELMSELSLQKRLVSKVLEVLEHLTLNNKEDRVFLGGTLNILNQPEFKDIAKIKNLLAILEEGKVLRELLEQTGSIGLNIRIGGENNHEGIAECSLVTSTYHVNGQLLGSIGLIGPTRMDYAKSVSLVEFIADALSRAIKQMM
jgi:heat-inducible transcriptional repressor